MKYEKTFKVYTREYKELGIDKETRRVLALARVLEESGGCGIESLRTAKLAGSEVVCDATLKDLAESFGVSEPAMLSTLRKIGLLKPCDMGLVVSSFGKTLSRVDGDLYWNSYLVHRLAHDHKAEFLA